MVELLADLVEEHLDFDRIAELGRTAYPPTP